MTELDVEHLRLILLGSALLLGIAMGALMQTSHFCTLGAIADWLVMGERLRLRMWLFAIAVAMVGTAGLAAGGLIDLSQSLYTGPRFLWCSYLIGGLCFGFGMVLASGCSSKTLVRLGGGSLKSLVVFLMMGLGAILTLRGPLAVLRIEWIDALALTLPSGQDLPRLLHGIGLDGPSLASVQLALGLGLGFTLAGYCVLEPRFRRLSSLIPSAAIGLLIVAAWWVSGHLGFLEENPTTLEPGFLATNSGRMESFSLVAPAAYCLEWLLFWSDQSQRLTIGIASTCGIVLGSAIAAKRRGSFRWEGFHGVEDTANHLIGGVLMGFGGITAIGCTIGQGLSGLSTLALGSFIAFGAIVVGAWLALQWQTWRLEHDPS